MSTAKAKATEDFNALVREITRANTAVKEAADYADSATRKLAEAQKQLGLAMARWNDFAQHLSLE